MSTEQWPPEWQRGFLESLVLGAIAAEDEPSYGYRIVQRLEEAGFGKIKGGTLYPILARLEAAGYVRSRWGEGEGGPGRKFLELTPTGARRVQEFTSQWQAFQNAVGRVAAAARREIG